MRIPINWLKEYVDLPEKLDELTHKLTMAGHMLDKLDKVNGNTAIDLELRGNRADCYSILGIAREVSALFNTPITYPKAYTKGKKVKQLSTTKLNVQTPCVKRVMMVEIRNAKIEKSPKWLVDKLTEYGVSSINNIVDLTNFVMLETGEPMHAFDLDKVGTDLHIRLAKKGEKMITFQDKQLVLSNEDLVWANDKQVLSVAGAIGGKENSISDTTKHILLEAANYDRANIRRSIHRHNLLTDAGIRHEKELDPNLVEYGINRFLHLVDENGWGEIQKEISDYYPKPVKPWKVAMDYDYLYSLTGLTIDKKKVKEIVKLLNFSIIKDTDKGLEVLVPTYRTDVTLEEDLIEEVLRIYGYDEVPTDTLSLEIPEDVTPSYIMQEINVKNALVAIGFDEVISLPFVNEKNLIYNKNLPARDVKAVRVINRPSPDFEELRMSMFPNLYAFTRKVINERGLEVRIFEIGKTYSKKGNKYVEKRKLGMMYWAKNGSNFAVFKGFLEGFFAKFTMQDIRYLDANDEIPLFDNAFFIHAGKTPVGLGGIVKDMYFAQIDLDLILGKEGRPKANLWPKYPPQIEDMTLVVPERTRIGDIVDIIRGEKNVEDVQLVDMYENAYTFRVWYQDAKKTLTDKEVEGIRIKIIQALKKKFRVTVK